MSLWEPVSLKPPHSFNSTPLTFHLSATVLTYCLRIGLFLLHINGATEYCLFKSG